MTDDLEGEEAVFQYLPRSDIMDDQVPFSIPCCLFGHNANVSDAATQVPAYNISRLIVFRLVCDFQGGAFSGEKGHQVGHPAVVNVRVSVL